MTLSFDVLFFVLFRYCDSLYFDLIYTDQPRNESIPLAISAGLEWL